MAPIFSLTSSGDRPISEAVSLASFINVEYFLHRIRSIGKPDVFSISMVSRTAPARFHWKSTNVPSKSKRTASTFLKKSFSIDKTLAGPAHFFKFFYNPSVMGSSNTNVPLYPSLEKRGKVRFSQG